MTTNKRKHNHIISFLIAFLQALLYYIAHLLIYIKCLFLFCFLCQANNKSTVVGLLWLCCVFALFCATQMKMKIFLWIFMQRQNIICELRSNLTFCLRMFYTIFRHLTMAMTHPYNITAIACTERKENHVFTVWQGEKLRQNIARKKTPIQL